MRGVTTGEAWPPIQKVREAANRSRSVVSLQAIQAAQAQFFKVHGVYSDSLEGLGLADEFPEGRKDGYRLIRASTC